MVWHLHQHRLYGRRVKRDYTWTLEEDRSLGSFLALNQCCQSYGGLRCGSSGFKLLVTNVLVSGCLVVYQLVTPRTTAVLMLIWRPSRSQDQTIRHHSTEVSPSAPSSRFYLSDHEWPHQSACVSCPLIYLSWSMRYTKLAVCQFRGKLSHICTVRHLWSMSVYSSVWYHNMLLRWLAVVPSAVLCWNSSKN